MSNATPMSSGGEYRKRLRSYRTPLTVRRSPRFLPQNVSNEAAQTAAKNQPASLKKPSSQKTHLQSPPISATPTQIAPPRETHEGCSSKCPREPLRPIENLQGHANPSQGKPLRRSPRFSSIPSSENAKASVEPVKERRRASRLMGYVGVSEGKENVGVDGLNDDKCGEDLGVRDEHGKKIGGLNDNVENEKDEREIRENEKKTKKKKKRKIGKCEENIESKKVNEGERCGSCDWTNEQNAALQRAYLVAKPSPHFWKKVAKMVPGKSAQECFDRVNGSFDTPPQPQPRSRAKQSMLSPISNFSLSGSKPTQHPMPAVRRLSGRKKTLVAQKTVRHLLRKHCVSDQTHEADYFSVLETSPSALAMDLPETSSPVTPTSLASPTGFLQKCNGSLSSFHKKMISRFKPLGQANDPSPEVLKRVKNVALHEKYIDQLHNRDARRTAASVAAARVNKNEGELKTGVVKAAKSALMSEAREFISHFQQMRASSHCNAYIDDGVDENEEEEDEDDADE